jgi:hypothetical protein
VNKFKKIFKFSLIALVTGFSILVLSVASLLAWVLISPESAWKVSQKYILPKGLEIQWEKMEYQADRKSWREWNFSWETKGLAIRQPEQFDIGIKDTLTRVTLNLWTEKPWLDFDTLKLEFREKSKIMITPSKAPTEEKSLYQKIKKILDYLEEAGRLAVINTLVVDVPSFEILLPGNSQWVVDGHVYRNHKEANRDDIRFNLNANANDSNQLLIQLQGVLNQQHYKSEKPLVTFDVDVKTESLMLVGKFQAFYEEERLKISGKPQIKILQNKKTMSIEPVLDLQVQQEFAELKTTMSVVGVPGPIVQLEAVEATLRLPFTDDTAWSKESAIFRVEAPVDLFLIDKDMRPPLEQACQCKLPEKFLVSVDGKIWVKHLMSEEISRLLIVDSNLKIQSVKNKLFSTDVSAYLRLLKENREWLFEPELNAKVDVYSFQGLRKFLDAKGIMIPAPLDILDGPLRLTAKSPVKKDQNDTSTTVNVECDLKSPTQFVLIKSDVILKLSNTLKFLDADANILIRKLRLELPPLDPVLGLPSVTADSRVLRQPIENKEKSFKLRIASTIRTENDGSIQLLSKYAKPHVPVTVSVDTKGSETSGFIRLEPFTVSYLRRNVHVEKLVARLKEKDDAEMPVDGKFRIEQGGYNIFIYLSGSVQSPVTRFESEPTLSKADIISVLLYGRVTDNLVSSEAETAGSFNAAMADRAIGIFGLWAFASTPIQSFSYNAATKVYTATVSLGEGLTAGVGTNWEQATNVQLRKRLSKRWALTASWSPTQDNRQEGRLVLQWEKRF